MITIVDYGMGNLRSLVGAFEYLGIRSSVTTSPSDVRAAERLVLPGVGSFRLAMETLTTTGLAAAIRTAVQEKGTPILGICLGMQLLTDWGEEDGPTPGLGVVRGRTVRLTSAEPSVKMPHVGFDDISVAPNSRLLASLPPRPHFYFLHSYAVRLDRSSDATSTCDYGGAFDSSVEAGHVLGVQFHPEKSQITGLRVLMRYASQRWPAC